MISDFGHLAEEYSFDFLGEVRRRIEHWYAEHHALYGYNLWPDAAVEIVIRPRWTASKALKRQSNSELR
jgi:hypothetical protein